MARAERIGFVPTMGYLHEGHLSLVRECGRDGPTSRWSASSSTRPSSARTRTSRRYPRDLEQDCGLPGEGGRRRALPPRRRRDVPLGTGPTSRSTGLQDKLCGRSRPGHFRGVATVVLKLFNIVRPDGPTSGEGRPAGADHPADGRDLDLAVEVVTCPIVREPDGLALSSRNAYLPPRSGRRPWPFDRACAGQSGRSRRGRGTRAGWSPACGRSSKPSRWLGSTTSRPSVRRRWSRSREPRRGARRPGRLHRPDPAHR